MRDKARDMPIAEDPAAVTALRVWHCNYSSLAALRHYSNLRTLVVATYPDPDLEPIVGLEQLEYVSLLHLPNVTDLAPLSKVRRLRTVRLATLPSWDASGTVTIVKSLKPLAGLPHLAHIELFGVRPEVNSLRDLEVAPSLVSVRVSKFPTTETRRFYGTTGLGDDFAPGPGVSDWD